MANVNFTPHSQEMYQRVPGYPDFALNGFFVEKFSKQLLKTYWATTYLPKITTSGYLSEIADIGDKVTVQREPDVHITPYVKGGKYEVESSLPEPFSLMITRGGRWTKGWEDRDLRRSNIPSLLAKTAVAARNKIATTIEQEFFMDYCDTTNGLGKHIPAYNQGANAGKISGKYNLGTIASPFQLTVANSVPYFMRFSRIIGETNVPNESQKRSVIIPSVVAYILAQNEHLLDADKRGSSQTSLTTEKLLDLRNVGTIYESNLLPVFGDDQDIYPVIAFTKEALNYAMTCKETQMEKVPMTDIQTVHGRFIYDWAAVRGDAMCIGFVQVPSIT